MNRQIQVKQQQEQQDQQLNQSVDSDTSPFVSASNPIGFVGTFDEVKKESTQLLKEIVLSLLSGESEHLLSLADSLYLGPSVSVASDRNSRRTMEDRHVIIHDLNKVCSLTCPKQYSYYAVFDGHVGIQAATYCASHLHHHFVENQAFKDGDIIDALKVAFAKCDAGCLERTALGEEKTGTTAVVCVKEDNNCLYFAWAGDSQAIIVADGQPEDLTPAHKPSVESERKRITDLGGSVIYTDTWRVGGLLAVSRAIGDPDHKPFVTSDPDTRVYELKGNEEFIVIACDGLWDSFTPDDVASHVFEYLATNSFSDPDEAANKTSQYLVDKAKKDGSTDNITAIVVFLRDIKQLLPTFPSDSTGNFFEISDVNTCVAANQLSSTRVEIDESTVEDSFVTATGSDDSKNTPATSFALLNDNEDKLIDASFVTAGFASPFCDSNQRNFYPDAAGDASSCPVNLINSSSPPPPLSQLSSTSIETLEASPSFDYSPQHTDYSAEAEAVEPYSSYLVEVSSHSPQQDQEVSTSLDTNESKTPTLPVSSTTATVNEESLLTSPTRSSENLFSLAEPPSNPPAQQVEEEEALTSSTSSLVEVLSPSSRPAQVSSTPLEIDELSTPIPPSVAADINEENLITSPSQSPEQMLNFADPPSNRPFEEIVPSYSSNLVEVSSPSPQPEQLVSTSFEMNEPVTSTFLESTASFNEEEVLTSPVRSPEQMLSPADPFSDRVEEQVVSYSSNLVEASSPSPQPAQVSSPSLETEERTSPLLPVTAPAVDEESLFTSTSRSPEHLLSPDPLCNQPSEANGLMSPSNLVEMSSSSPQPDQVVSTLLEVDEPKASPLPESTAALNEDNLLTSPSPTPEHLEFRDLLPSSDPLCNAPVEGEVVSSSPNLVQVSSPSPQPAQVPSTTLETEESKSPILPVVAAVAGAVAAAGICATPAVMNKVASTTSASRKPLVTSSTRKTAATSSTSTTSTAGRTPLAKTSGPLSRPTRSVATSSTASSSGPSKARTTGTVSSSTASRVNGTASKVNGAINRVNGTSTPATKAIGSSSLLTKKVAPATAATTTAKVNGVTKKSSATSTASKVTGVSSRLYPGPKTTTTSSSTNGTAGLTVGPAVPKRPTTMTSASTRSASSFPGKSTTNATSKTTTSTTTTSSLQSRVKTTTSSASTSTRVTSTVASRLNGLSKSKTPSSSSTTDGKVNDKTGVTKKVTVTGVSSRLYPGPKTATPAPAPAKSTLSGR